MITLPSVPRRAHLRSFWLALCMMLSFFAILVMWIWALPHPVTIPLCTGAGLIAIGLVMPDWVQPFYRMWNKVTRKVSRGARLALMGICYFTIFVVVARAGAKITRGRHTAKESGWVSRKKLAENRDSLSFVETARLSRQGWASTYLGWARRTGNFWAVIFLPFLALLSLLAEEDEEALPAHIYTLF